MSEPAAAEVPPYAAAVRVLRDRQPVNRGSGVLIDARHVLTCAHVVADAEPENAALPLRRSFDEPVASGWSQASARTVAIDVLVGFRRSWERDWRRASYVAEDIDNDLALLELDRPVHGAAPPLIRDGRPVGIGLVAFASQGEGFERHDIGGGGVPARRTLEGRAAPHSASHHHGLPGGYSGAPMIAVDGDGRHWLEGICTYGGVGSPTGGMAGLGAVTEFLERSLGARSGPPPAATPGVPPGIAAEFALGGEGDEPLRFRWWTAERRALFRAGRPVSAAAERRLRNEPTLAGGDRLPAHLPGVAAMRTCMAGLERLHGPGLRLPTPAELDAMAATDGPAAPAAVPPGGLPVLSSFWDGARLATPLGTAEWAEDRDGPRCLVRRKAGEPLAPLAAETPHLRHAVRPLFDPG